MINFKKIYISYHHMPDISEGLIRMDIPEGDIKKKDKVFYNLRMKLNRDISIAAISTFSSLSRWPLKICDALSSSGIRGLRISKECKDIEYVKINDMNPDALDIAKDTARKNHIENAIFSQEDANVLLSENRCLLDYIDIDPFGSPAGFLDSCARAASGRSLVGITATDTAPLCGTYKDTCIRRYGSIPLREDIKHEVGLRILISKIAEAFNRHDKSFMPMISYSKIHYMRIMGISTSRTRLATSESRKYKGYVSYCRLCGYRSLENDMCDETCPYCSSRLSHSGPLWTGPINSSLFIDKMLDNINERDDMDEAHVLLRTIYLESRIQDLFYDIHSVCKKNRLDIPKTAKLIEALKSKGFYAVRTHLSLTGIRTDSDYKTLISAIKETSRSDD